MTAKYAVGQKVGLYAIAGRSMKSGERRTIISPVTTIVGFKFERAGTITMSARATYRSKKDLYFYDLEEYPDCSFMEDMLYPIDEEKNDEEQTTTKNLEVVT